MKSLLAIAVFATLASAAEAQQTDAALAGLAGEQPPAAGADQTQPAASATTIPSPEGNQSEGATVRKRRSTGNRIIDRQTKRQNAGQYDQPGPIKPVGLFQEAWNEPLRNKGVSQRSPGYVRYDYSTENIYPVRTREGMITTLRFPVDETVQKAFAGDADAFQLDQPAGNTIAIRSLYPGTDTSLTAYGASGRVYNFYVRSEGVNSRTITDFMVDIVGPVKANRGNEGPYARLGTDGMLGAGSRAGVTGGSADEASSDYLDRVGYRPENIVNDLQVYVPKGWLPGVMPVNVFRDDVFTYIDFGERARQMTEWPVPTLVVQDVESPVGFRTGGPGGRMIIVEAIGDIVLRNGQRAICIRRKGTPEMKAIVRKANVAQEANPPFVPRSATTSKGQPQSASDGTEPTYALSLPPQPIGPAYRLDLGGGERTELATRFAAMKGRNPAVLSRLSARVIDSGGEARLKTTPVATLAEGMRICASLSATGETCAVERQP